MQKGRNWIGDWKEKTTNRSSTPTSLTPKQKNHKQKQLKEAYTQCLADHAAGADACTKVAKAYLECRMER